MSNEQMIPGRYARWARARRLVSAIQSCLLAGGTVTVSTPLRTTHYRKAEYAAMFRADRSGAYAQHGHRWDCIDYCAIQFWR